jgi:hypothetical protein
MRLGLQFPPQWQQVIALWLVWYVALLTFQQVNWARLTVERPDRGYAWTERLTGGEYDGPATGPWFYARWDSYRYVEIAQNSYENPKLATFFPGYPLLMRGVDRGLLTWVMAEDERNSRMALAGVLVSGALSLLAALGMYTLSYERLGGPALAWRATFYLLIFPTAMFMGQLYTESAYLALSLWGLVFAYRQRWWIAALLCAYATLTRPTGLFLALPLLTIWLNQWWIGQTPPLRTLLAVMTPALTFWLFNRYLAANGIDTFQAQQDFGRYLLHPYALLAFAQQLGWMTASSNGLVQIGLDIGLTLLATFFCLREWNRHAGLALYGLAATWVSLATGQLVSQNRYVLVVLPIFFVLARWGERPWADRAWTIVSLLLFSLYLIQFTQGLWTG